MWDFRRSPAKPVDLDIGLAEKMRGDEPGELSGHPSYCYLSDRHTGGFAVNVARMLVLEGYVVERR